MSEARPSADERRLSPQGRERRMQLIAAAGELFAERGYDDTRIVDIVERAGVAKGLFYWYFDNKEALFRDLVEQNRLSLRRAQAAAIDSDAEPLLRIRQATEASVVYMARHARLFSLLEVEVVDQKFTDVLRQGTEVHAADTAALIAEAVAEGTVRDEDPQLLAYGVVGAVGYYSHFQRTGRIDTGIEELAAFVGRFVVCSLAADESIARRVLAAEVAAPEA
ncbi:MAG: TetR/AcrR family transcriptional regulator [Acidimicrobiales bacterium]|nr:TetR/AcrR family transcriptional regulator [Acidimicrobiales bacterium]